MAKKPSPTQRTLAYLRKIGFNECAITEHWNAYAKVRQDLFGFIDLLYMDDLFIVAVQVTSGSNHAARRTKIVQTPAAASWLRCGGRIEVWSWSQRRLKRGGRLLWVPRVEGITADNLTNREV